MTDSNDNLTNMIDHIVDNDNEQAEQCFHDYLKPKLQSTIRVINPDEANED